MKPFTSFFPLLHVLQWTIEKSQTVVFFLLKQFLSLEFAHTIPFAHQR